MILLDMQIQEEICGEVLPALRTSVDVGLLVVDLVFVIGSKRERFSVRWKRAAHHFFSGWV